MYRPKFLKVLAIFLAINILQGTILPTVIMALTSGPTAPEFNSFEPANGNNMVNMLTGDLTYNMPILNVPGPGGGYSVSLSHHAGIKPNEQASWVGLGWTLNVGAITRNAVKYPDDTKGGLAMSRYYDSGGTVYTKSYEIGKTLSAFGIPDFTGGLTITTSKHSNGSKSTGIHNAHIGIINKLSGSSSPDSRGMNMYTVSSGTSGLASTKTIRYFMDRIDFSESYGSLTQDLSSLYSNEATDYDAFALHNTTSITEKKDPYTELGGVMPAFDNYSVTGNGVGGSIVPSFYENKSLPFQSVNQYEYKKKGGFCIYNCGENVKIPIRGGYKVNETSLKKVQFRFDNDFSNKFTREDEKVNFTSGANSKPVDLPSISPESGPFEKVLAGSRSVEWFTNYEIKNKTKSGIIDYFDEGDTERLRPMEFQVYLDHLQDELSFLGNGNNYTTGLDEGGMPKDENFCTDSRINRLKPMCKDVSEQIGGIVVTTENGYKYHYALPTYNFTEYSRIEYKGEDNAEKTKFNDRHNYQPYAYQWLLTAITGPDYVDRNNDGKLDGTDWGYWVEFDYGKWTDGYQWRTPHSGGFTDMDENYKTFSYGVKELYYLDAIKTKTHTAIFVKSVRKDGFGVTSRTYGGSKPVNKYFFPWPNTSYFDWFDFSTGRYKSDQRVDGTNGGNSYVPHPAAISDAKIPYRVAPESTLKLDEIVLLKNEDWEELNVKKEDGGLYNAYEYDKLSNADYHNGYEFSWKGELIPNNVSDGTETIKVKLHNGDRVFDNGDFEKRKDGMAKREILMEKSIKSIKLNTEYNNLCLNTPNSFDHPFADYIPFVTFSGNDFLDACNVRGFPIRSLSLEETINRLEQSFGIDDIRAAALFYTKYPAEIAASCDFTYVAFDVPYDLLYSHTGKLSLESVKVYGKGGADILPPTRFSYKKYEGHNSFNQEKYDHWGMYKSDFVNENNLTVQKRDASAESGQYKDIWSLSEVETPLGTKIKIEYESDSYSKAILHDDYIRFSPQSPLVLQAPTFTGRLFSDVGDLREIFSKGYYNFILTYKDGSDYRTEEKKLYAYSIEDNNFRVDPNSFAPSSGNTSDLVSILCKPVIDRTRYGGDLRVKSISTFDGFRNTSEIVEYDWTNPKNGLTSGYISYEPNAMQFLSRSYTDGKEMQGVWAPDSPVEYPESTLKKIYDQSSPIMATLSVAPGPTVLYEYVTVSSKVKHHEDGRETAPLNKVEYRFKAFEENMLGKQTLNHFNGTYNFQWGAESAKSATTIFRDFTSQIGRPEHVKVMDATGVVTQEVKYTYLDEKSDNQFGYVNYENDLLTKYKGQGVIHSAHNQYRILNGNKHIAVVTKKEKYPSVLVEMKSSNYITKQSNSVKYLAFDFLSGQATHVKNIDGYGNEFLTVRTAAYHRDEYTKMGVVDLKSSINDGIDNKNMLNALSESITYKLGSDYSTTTVDIPNVGQQPASIVSATIQTWTKSHTINNYTASTDKIIPRWRPDISYSWSPKDISKDGSVSEFEPFNWNNISNRNKYWLLGMQITLFNTMGLPIEYKDMNGNYASVKYGHNSTMKVSSIVNAKYSEFATADMEDIEGETTLGIPQHGGGDLVYDERMRKSKEQGASVHTGNYSLEIGNGENTYYGLQPERIDNSKLPRKFTARVWVKPSVETATDNGKLSITQGNNTVLGTLSDKNIDGWYLLTAEILVENNTDVVMVTCKNDGAQQPLFFDDFRFYPSDASLTMNVYETNTGRLMAQLNQENTFTSFVYDGMGSVVETYEESFEFGVKKVASKKYNYGRDQN